MYFSDSVFVSAGGRLRGSVRPGVRGKKHERERERESSKGTLAFLDGTSKVYLD